MTTTAPPQPQQAQQTRATDDALSLEFGTTSEAFEVLGVLCQNVADLYDKFGKGKWRSAKSANQIAIAAAALHYFADALSDPMIARQHAERAEAWRAAQEAATAAPPPPPESPAAPRVRIRSLKASTAARIERLRSEFADDPAGIDLLIDLARAAQETPAPAPKPAPPTI